MTLFGFTFYQVVFFIVLVVPTAFFLIKIFFRISDKREQQEPKSIRKLTKVYDIEPDRDEFAKAFAGFDDPEVFMDHLKDVVKKMRANSSFKLRASEASFIASEIGDKIVKSDDGKYYIISHATVRKYIDKINQMSLPDFVERLNALEKEMRPERNEKGQIVVNAAELFHRIQNRMIGTGKDQYFITMAEIGDGSTIEADMAFIAVGNEEHKKLLEQKSAEKKQDRNEGGGLIEKDKEGNRIFRRGDGSVCIIHRDGRVEIQGSKEKEQIQNFVENMAENIFT